MNLKDMQKSAGEVSDLMKVLSNRNRLLILCRLVEGEASVGELAKLLDIREQAMSQQLALLRKDGLVKTRRDGQTIYYSLAKKKTSKLLRFLHKNFCPA